jgi:hypothetical protein
MSAVYSRNELAEMVRSGWQVAPYTPGLTEVAREILRPMVEGLTGEEVIYHCRAAFLLGVEKVMCDDEGFWMQTAMIKQYPPPEPHFWSRAYRLNHPVVGGHWATHRLYGKAIKPALVDEWLIVDREVIAAVKAATNDPMTIHRILSKAWAPVSSNDAGVLRMASGHC